MKKAHLPAPWSAVPAALNWRKKALLLLDEIGEMPAATQAKLLRVLEDRKLRRLGSKVETPVDVRVLAATNKVPEEAVARGELRGDLYYRLNVFNILEQLGYYKGGAAQFNAVMATCVVGSS